MHERSVSSGLVIVAMAACGLVHAADEPAAAKVPTVFAAYATSIREPWNQVIHAALRRAEQESRVRYEWKDALDTVEKQLAAVERAIADKTDIVIADSVDARDEILAVARRHPATSFLVAGAGEPQKPNVSTFDSALVEPAYLCGLLAGKLSTANSVGIVAGKHESEPHRTINAFIAGVQESNPDAKVRLDFIDSWFDPEKARAAALKQIAAGADVIFAERAGAIAAARETGVRAFGNMIDQHAEAPDHVISGTIWNMQPVVDHVVARVAAGVVEAENLRRFATLAKGGVALAPWHGHDEKLPAELLEMVRKRQAEIVAGTHAVPSDPAEPKLE
ncbi:MAG: BMP family ABC transporter substrate-binding protein [Planctomycetia bacterium]|jgi:basic membrane protein A